MLCYLAAVLTAGAALRVLGNRFPRAFSWARVLPERAYERKLDINTASGEDLAALPFIGDVTARRIVAYRDENGPFRDLAELKEVRGIGPDKYLGLIAHVTISDFNPGVP